MQSTWRLAILSNGLRHHFCEFRAGEIKCRDADVLCGTNSLLGVFAPRAIHALSGNGFDIADGIGWQRAFDLGHDWIKEADLSWSPTCAPSTSSPCSCHRSSSSTHQTRQARGSLISNVRFGGEIMRLEGKVAIISGTASGMGAATARRFAKEGAKVVIADMLEEEGRQVAADITRTNGTAEFMRLDVTSEDEWKSVVEATVQKSGRLDILVNNAGISGSAVSDMLDTGQATASTCCAAWSRRNYTRISAMVVSLRN